METKRKRYPPKTKWRPENSTIYGHPIVPELRKESLDVKTLFVGTLVTRLLAECDRRRKWDATRYKPAHRFSWANLSRLTGVPYWTIVHYFVRRTTPLDIEMIDKVLWVLKLSVLDLLQPQEVVSYLQTLDGEQLMPLRESMKRLLDRLNASAHTTTSDPNAQSGDETDI